MSDTDDPTTADEYRDVVDTLAARASTPPPSDLRDPILTAAAATRAPLRTIDPPPALTTTEAFTRTVTDLRAVLVDLDVDDWLAVTTTPYGRVRDVVAHLAGIEAVTLGWMGEGPEADASLVGDHVAVTAATIAELADHPPSDVLDRWWAAAERVIDACARVDMARPVIAHDIPTDVDNMLVMRTFEVWSHTDDILVALGRGRAPLDPARAALMSARLMAVIGLVMQFSGPTLPDATIRVVLTGRGGGCYDLPLTPAAPAAPSSLVVTDVTDLCRVAGRRLDADAIDVVVEGDSALVRRLLVAAGAFARD